VSAVRRIPIGQGCVIDLEHMIWALGLCRGKL